VRSVAFGLAMLALLASATYAAPGAATGSPRLTMVSRTPLVVRGTGFRPEERVTVSALTSLRTVVVRTRATAGGVFRVRFGSFTQPCGRPFAVRARGAAGSSALLRLAAPPCVPPPIA
jgi:hypothetical protein